MKFRNVIFLVLLSTSGIARAEEVAFDGIKTLDLQSASGDVRLNGKQTSGTKVAATKSKDWNGSCELKVWRTGSTVFVTADRKQKLTKTNCKVDFVIDMPATSDIKGDVGAGNVKVEGIDGNLDLDTGSGNVSITKGNFPKVSVNTGDGNVLIDGNVKSAEVATGNGNVNMVFRGALGSGSTTVSTGTGNVSIKVSSGSSLDASLSSGTGRTHSEIKPDPKAPYAFDLSSGTGNLSIEKM